MVRMKTIRIDALVDLKLRLNTAPIKSPSPNKKTKQLAVLFKGTVNNIRKNS